MKYKNYLRQPYYLVMWIPKIRQKTREFRNEREKLINYFWLKEIHDEIKGKTRKV